MNKLFFKCSLFSIVLLTCQNIEAQNTDQNKDESSTYRVTPLKVNDLIHTKLDVSFDYGKRYLYGKEWLTLKPHFYETDSLTLDAKGMDIKEIAIIQGKVKTTLKYTNDGEQLFITLNRKYKSTENYIIFIDYTAKPNELKVKGSKAITDAKGLYFINPDGKDDKPIQIWTQGETEASSAWFPTIDKPNQKTTSEIAMTVLAKYTTLSNGKLVSQKPNINGTRTDIWKMDLPHSPYLFMMAVGDFKIYKDTYNGKEVSYYLEPKYAPYAKQIFGKTPDMMNFYSKMLGVEYPWVKYAQIVARDYVSGAMENTSATLHGEYVQKTARELLDDNQESTIAHELFHQWFGDYVTAESWSNLTMNESFATFGEVLWHGHDAGQDAEDRSRYEKLQNCLRSSKNGVSPPLARFYYKNHDDMFDNISYSKGSIILYAIKNQMGDAAFFKSLNRYLTTNALKSGETHQLRLAMEDVTGKDWSPYFNQWYYQGGNPILNVEYGFANGKATIAVKQIQDNATQTFSLPLKVDFYVNGTKIRKDILIDKREQNFSFDVPAQPNFVDLDPDKILVGQVIDNKKVGDYLFQYKNAPTYYNRIEAIKYATNDKSHEAQLILLAGLEDQQDDLRILSIKAIDLGDNQIKEAALKSLLNIAKNDKKTASRAAAIVKLASTGDAAYKGLMQESIKNQSYNVIAGGILGLSKFSADESDKALSSLDEDTKKHVTPLIKKFSSQK
ncbi:M1 family metallopeptidase [Flavobacterium hibernum]|uniref:Aminopeptidase N n=1 Tax=Flavobacterium hibernum TaxID=37752 RepID=A0A0D0ESU6_9FLAO|nr:M1 family metallopeptidase [Flavobacterium hibernum]KIO51468.1 peptidase M1 [Flavobacterium hibernum]OXA84912.1 peptidase M1 [Flavobacterium hibernum]STO19322.1 Aminopeptidase N [Flavobacterium hibernum]